MKLLKHYATTTTHKGTVMWYLIKFCGHILWRGVIHDLSKYTDSEAPGFALNLKRLDSPTYGSTAYKAMIAKRKLLTPSIEHHHKHNRHHPEFHSLGIRDMDLFDIVEMLCDWVAQARASKEGNVFVSIKTGQDRFDIPPELSLIFKNTTSEAKRLKKNE